MNKKLVKYRVVYGIKNLINKKMYVGSASNYFNRTSVHKRELRGGHHCNKHLQGAWNKYGEKSFVFGVIQELSDNDEIAEREQYWMDFYKVCDRQFGYNILPNARTFLGHKFSDEIKAKMSKAKKGKPWTESQRIAMSVIDRSKNGRLGVVGSLHFKSRPIIRFLAENGQKVDEWESINQCAKSIGIHKPNIVECLKGRIKQIKGFRFEYK